MIDKNEEAIFSAAIELKDPAEQARFVAQACGGDHRLLADVEALLRSHDARSLLDSPVLDAGTIEEQSRVTEGPGSVIGRYKLLERIGEGGMAVVYMAEQQEPIRRKVALKIIKLGMDTRQVIARFEAERQALAMMDHPNIAKVLDAGATETGRPYFVMELVQGVSITDYCDQNNLSTKDRLDLFIQVCNAVQHAHTKGIIHRDIKPSNVMVTHHDGKPVPKVIDFGIAKATNQRLTEKTLFTRYAHIIGTPAYMSPEQAELSDLDIDTRTDIYSLGVLLYELLTGTTPFSEEELRKAGYLEMQKVIREQEPAKPSTKLTTLGKTLTDVAKHRNCTPDLLRRSLRGDLDWIVMKSLEKDRARRYETANSLSQDIQRHLEHEPVLARGPSTTYRLHKFLCRHRSQAVTSLMIVVAVGAGSILLSMWNRDRARLMEAEGFRHRGILSQAREQYARAERQAASETIQPILDSPYVGPEARLLQAGIFVEDRRFEEAASILGRLLHDRPDIAGAAHSLLARILWESESLNADTLKQIEEHRRKAQALLPETATAYFQQAVTAITVKEQLAALDRALQLDRDHYESRRLRAFTYYASRKYDRLRDDALIMTHIRPGDPLGHSLRAVALRELVKYADAILEYDSAMARTKKEDPQYLDLATQRCETLLRMGDYNGAMAGARECLIRWPHRLVFQYPVFCALSGLGDYQKADAVFRQIAGSSPTARNEFAAWATKYVFGVLERGGHWHPPDREPVGAAFLPMIEAEEIYRELSAQAHPIVSDAFSGEWSPEGSKLAFSMGVHGYSGVAIYDPATDQTDLLIAPGEGPRWSPDGQYIAFVRNRQSLPLEELIAPERKDETRGAIADEVWIMKSDGSEPWRLARGGWPTWSRDSTHLYYHSRQDGTLCSIAIAEPDAEPTRIGASPSAFPSVSPDGQRFACCQQDGRLAVKDFTLKTVTEWAVPFNTWRGPIWSPTGDELYLGAGGSARDRTGLWVCRFDSNEPVKILSGQIMAASRALNRRKFVFGLRQPYYGLWAADVDPNIPIFQALGPAQTMQECRRDMLHLYARRIETDPLDASTYSERALYFNYYQHDLAQANADMRRWSAAASGPVPCDFRRVIDMPFDCELVFSAERPVNNIPILSIAFGQKGKCEMKVFEIPMVVLSLLGLGLFSSVDAPPAQANFTFGTPVNLGSNVNTSAWDDGQSMTADGLSMFFATTRVGGGIKYDIFVMTRESLEDDWSAPVDLGSPVNMAGIMDFTPAISADGLTLVFSSDRPGGSGLTDIYMTTRATKNSPWAVPVNLGPLINSPDYEVGLCLSADTLELYFGSARSGGMGNMDLWVARRATPQSAWGPPVNLGATVNSPYEDYSPCLSPDGLCLMFCSARPGGYGSRDAWMTTRASRNDPWRPPVNLGPPLNTPSQDWPGCLSLDGSTFYFGSDRAGGYGASDLWQVSLKPVLDFNADGKVDAADLALLVADWGKSNSVCDIGPFPWGDSVVDEKDLSVLMPSLMTPGPKASDVPRDVVLSWISPASTRYCDVYFGTSCDAVTDANRANPGDVLVSYAQTATTYDPNGLLDYSTTYYWRVDFVGADLVVYKGPVLSFTRAAYSYPIKNIVATASSAKTGMGPEKTVDGSGLGTNDGHSTKTADMWLSSAAMPQWIQFQFDKVYSLHQMQVWNHNSDFEAAIGFGARTVNLEYSTDGTIWTPLAGVPEFTQAPGTEGYAANTTVDFGGVLAKFVKLTITRNWGTAPSTGLSEVRFFYLPATSATSP